MKIQWWQIERAARRVLGNWHPTGQHSWFRWWMYPPGHQRRTHGISQTWEWRLRSKLTPGMCEQCHARNNTHQMRCPRQGQPGARNWSQNG